MKHSQSCLEDLLQPPKETTPTQSHKSTQSFNECGVRKQNSYFGVELNHNNQTKIRLEKCYSVIEMPQRNNKGHFTVWQGSWRQKLWAEGLF